MPEAAGGANMAHRKMGGTGRGAGRKGKHGRMVSPDRALKWLKQWYGAQMVKNESGETAGRYYGKNVRSNSALKR